ncbi:uncharacterized protein NPIL_315741 [Nephila pilipes]|uniref:Uncharacterized protein n=1 Tax=Nephila pilipes TaxID=299642 RepID=A0A8X6TAK6_NEPPI|nr:uncharacterized protein NPIL_315741 [Nephila pilipes]
MRCLRGRRRSPPPPSNGSRKEPLGKEEKEVLWSSDGYRFKGCLEDKNVVDARNSPPRSSSFIIFKSRIPSIKFEIPSLISGNPTHPPYLDPRKRNLGRTKEKFADFLKSLVESYLPENVLRVWERCKISGARDDATRQRSLEKHVFFGMISKRKKGSASEGFVKNSGIIKSND